MTRTKGTKLRVRITTGVPLTSVLSTNEKKIDVQLAKKRPLVEDEVPSSGGASPRSIGKFLREDALRCTSQECPARDIVSHVHVADIKDIKDTDEAKLCNTAEVVALSVMIEENTSGRGGKRSNGFNNTDGHCMPSTASMKMTDLVKKLNPGQTKEGGCTIFALVINQFWKPIQIEFARSVSHIT